MPILVKYFQKISHFTAEKDRMHQVTPALLVTSKAQAQAQAQAQALSNDFTFSPGSRKF
jgi:hypothetical protein